MTIGYIYKYAPQHKDESEWRTFAFPSGRQLNVQFGGNGLLDAELQPATFQYILYVKKSDLSLTAGQITDSETKEVLRAYRQVVLVAFGMHTKYHYKNLISTSKRRLAEVLRLFPDIGFVVSSKLETEIFQGPNVLSKTQIEQRAIIRQRKTTVFFSHCGFNSIMEAAMSGVPVIGFPIQYDQPGVARRVLETGIGLSMWQEHATINYFRAIVYMQQDDTRERERIKKYGF